MSATSSIQRPGGKVIKTLKHIRYIRSTPPASPENLIVEPKEQASEAYVQHQHKPAGRVQSPAPPYGRARRSPVTPAPEAEMLFDWFHAERPHFPDHSYNLTPWAKVANPARFYEAIERDIAMYPDGPRSHTLIDDLLQFQQLAIRPG